MNLFYTKKKFLDAVAKGDPKTVEAYLAAAKSWALVQDDKSKDYALHYAARSGNANITRQLLDAGAVIYPSGGNGQTPLHTAVAAGFIDIVKILLDARTDYYISYIDQNRMTPLHTAIQTGRTDILKLFLDTKKADLNTAERPALYYAAECGQLDCLKILLAAGADPNVPKSETHYEYDHDDYYYSHRHEPRKTTVTHFSPLNCACTNNHTEIAGDLLKAGAKALPSEFPLHVAAEFGNVPLMTLLIQNGFDPKQVNQNRETILHKVSKSRNRENQPEAVLFVLAQGVDKNAPDKENRTALSYVQQFALTDIVKILQDPLPAQLLAPVKPVIQPVVEMPAPAAAGALPLAQTPLEESESWTMAGARSVVHMTLYPGLGRRLTEIFNFESRERITITENFSLKTETMGPHQAFDSIGDEALQKALEEFRRLGGKADDAAVFGSRPMKMKLKPT